MKCCPKCDAEMKRIEDEPDVGIVGGWYCHTCNESYIQDDDDDLEYE